MSSFCWLVPAANVFGAEGTVSSCSRPFVDVLTVAPEITHPRRQARSGLDFGETGRVSQRLAF